MRKVTTICWAFLVLLSSTALAQTAEVSKKFWGGKKLANAPKKVFISQFRINYQLLHVQEESTQGGSKLGGGYKGSAKVNLTLGLRGPQKEHFVQMTDALYAKFTDQLKAGGYEIVDASAMEGIAVYDGWEMVKGGELNEAQYPGFASVSPTGYSYFVPGTKKSGKEKTSFLDMGPKISKQGNGVIVIDINIVVPFSEEAESQGSKALSKVSGSIAKVVAETSLRISADDIVSKGWMNQSVTSTEMNVYYQASMAEQGGGSVRLKKTIFLPEALEKKKYKAVETANSDIWGTNAGLFTVFNVDDKFMKSVQPIDVDVTKYTTAVQGGAGSFLSKALEEFKSALGE